MDSPDNDMQTSILSKIILASLWNPHSSLASALKESWLLIGFQLLVSFCVFVFLLTRFILLVGVCVLFLLTSDICGTKRTLPAFRLVVISILIPLLSFRNQAKTGDG